MTLKDSHAPRVSRAVVRRMMRLLEMEYKPSELADEIGITAKTIYDTYLPAGLPHRRDAGGNIWIVGTTFVKWADEVLQKGLRRASQRKEPIGENQGYCVKCQKVRDFSEITRRKTMSKNRVMLYGSCSECGTKMSTIKKGVKDDKS